MGIRWMILATAGSLPLAAGQPAMDAYWKLGRPAPRESANSEVSATPLAAGQPATPAEWRGHPAIVLFFVNPECPLSNSYVPELNRIQQDYAQRGVLAYAVLADPDLSPAAAAAY